jgi:hypothetical protein
MIPDPKVNAVYRGGGYLERVMDVRLSSEARRPSGSEATVLFSTLNSSSSTQLARDLGMEPVDNRLYLGG